MNNDANSKLGIKGIKEPYEARWNDGTTVIIYPDGTVVRRDTGEIKKFGSDQSLINQILQQFIIRNTAPINQWIDNVKSFAGTSIEQLTSISPATVCNVIRLYAPAGNAGTLSIGGKDLTTANASIVLDAGEAIELSINDASKIYCIASNSADTVAWSLLR